MYAQTQAIEGACNRGSICPLGNLRECLKCKSATPGPRWKQPSRIIVSRHKEPDSSTGQNFAFASGRIAPISPRRGNPLC
jgi:hypothetical protein